MVLYRGSPRNNLRCPDRCASKPVTMNMYGEFRSFEVQKTLLTTAVREMLSTRYADTFEVTLTILLRSAKIRHTFAHGLWGESSDVPDALLLADPKGFWELAMRDAKYQWNLPPVLRGRMLAADRIEKSYISVDPKSCLEHYSCLIDDAYNRVTLVYQMIVESTSQRHRLYLSLCSLRDVREALVKHMKAQKRTYRLPPVSRVPAHK